MCLRKEGRAIHRYNWHAIQDNGLVVTRWDADGVEQRPDPWHTRQFHIFPTSEKRFPVLSCFVPKGMKFRYIMRKHIDAQSSPSSPDFTAVHEGFRDVIYIVGWEHPDEPGAACYTLLLPDGRIEQTNDIMNHITRYERNIDVHGLTAYEMLGVTQPEFNLIGLRPGEGCVEIFADCEIIDPHGPSDVEATLDAIDVLAFGQSLGMLPE